jgi:hypothetical protein
LTQNIIKHNKVKMWGRNAGNYVDYHCTFRYLIVISVIVYVLRQNCRAAGWWRVKFKIDDKILFCNGKKYYVQKIGSCFQELLLQMIEMS